MGPKANHLSEHLAGSTHHSSEHSPDSVRVTAPAPKSCTESSACAACHLQLRAKVNSVSRATLHSFPGTTESPRGPPSRSVPLNRVLGHHAKTALHSVEFFACPYPRVCVQIVSQNTRSHTPQTPANSYDFAILRRSLHKNLTSAPTLVKSTNLLDFCTCIHRLNGRNVSFN